MKRYGSKIIAEVGNVLSNGKSHAFAFKYNENHEYTEEAIGDDIKEVSGGYLIRGVMHLSKKDATKKYLISKLWTNDDQIAIILNKERSDEDAAMYEFMQEWREWFGGFLKGVGTTIE